MIPHDYLLAKMTQKLLQMAKCSYWHKDKCPFLGHTQANQAYPDQTAPKQLSDQGILYL